MKLLLSMLSWPDGTESASRSAQAELGVGRGRESDWMLPDPQNKLSRRHCLFVPSGDRWRVVDLSLNGTFVNGAPSPLGRNQSHELHDGDRIQIGSYVIEARYDAPASLMPPAEDRAKFSSRAPFGGQPAFGSSNATPRAPYREGDLPSGPWQDDPWQAERGWMPPETRSPADPLADPEPPAYKPPYARHGHAGAESFLGQPQADDAPPFAEAWHPPPPAKVFIPEDWDADDLALPQPPPAPAPHIVPNPAAMPAPSPPPTAKDAADMTAYPARHGAEPGQAALLAAFLRGAQLDGMAASDPERLLEAAGAALREVVHQLRDIQSTRSSIKREFRILTTVVGAEKNNPVKFSPDTATALRALLGGRDPAATLGEMLNDVRTHELAMLTAMRDAVDCLLEDMDPAKLRNAEQGVGALLPAHRRARAFDAYEALHARIVQSLIDDFDSVFGKAFARGYERIALGESPPPSRKRR